MMPKSDIKDVRDIMNNSEDKNDDMKHKGDDFRDIKRQK
jgi:hypothetical protein